MKIGGIYAVKERLEQSKQLISVFWRYVVGRRTDDHQNSTTQTQLQIKSDTACFGPRIRMYVLYFIILGVGLYQE